MFVWPAVLIAKLKGSEGEDIFPENRCFKGSDILSIMFYNQDTKYLESCYIYTKLIALKIYLQYAKVGWIGESNIITKAIKCSILK